MEKIIHDIQTNEITVQELSPIEIKEIQEIQEMSAKKEAKIELELEIKEKAKTTLLAKLGITEDEAKLLLG